MRKTSWFKAEAVWTAALLYLLPALGALASLAALAVGWLRADGSSSEEAGAQDL